MKPVTDNEINRKHLNRRQTELRELLTSTNRQADGLALFLNHHARLHTASMAGLGLWSFEDVVFDGLSDGQARRLLPGEEHSIVWLIWHLARIEDVTMNLLVAGTSQRFTTDDWQTRMNVSMVDTGNGMPPEKVEELSRQVDVQALRDYRKEVGSRTQEIVRGFQPERLTERVSPERLQRIQDEGAVLLFGYNVIEYWGRRDMMGLLLMPPTRHCIGHLNEAWTLKKKLI